MRNKKIKMLKTYFVSSLPFKFNLPDFQITTETIRTAVSNLANLLSRQSVLV